ncbi:hypothetical protein ACFE04_000173 [Oxalis oulophora]
MAFPLIVFLLLLLTSTSHARNSDTLKQGEFLSQNQTLKSANEVVEMGFFSPGNNGAYNFLGIWFVKDKFKKPVWIANRDNALLSASGNLTFDASGNLIMTDAQLTRIVLNNDKPVSSSGNETIARLLDSGNFVLLQGDNFTFLTNNTDVLLSYNTSSSYDAVWYRFEANGDISQYKLTKSGITLTKYPLCDVSATNVSSDCVDTVSDNCKAGDEFVSRNGLLRNSMVVNLGPSDCEITCQGNCSCTAYVSSSDGCQLYYGATSDLDNVIARGNDTIYMRSGGGNGVGSNLWWIITIAITMFFIFVVVGYFIWRKFYLKEENTSLLSFESGSNYLVGASSLDLSRG